MIYKSYLVEQNINIIKENLILFYGENLGLKKDFKNKIKKRYEDCDFMNTDQEEILKNQNNFFNEINNLSLFNKEKIYFIEQTSDKLLDILEEVLEKKSNQKIVLFSDVLDKKSKIRSFFEKSTKCGAVPCYADNELTIKKIITNALKDFDGLSPNNVNLILENSNLDRIKLNNELEKIIIYFQDKKIVTSKLETLLDLKVNDNFNILKDEALLGNKLKTNKLLSDTIIESEKNIFYLSSINLRLNKLKEAITASRSLNLEDAISSLRPPIFWKDKANFTIQAKKWNSDKIKNILNKTYSLEIKIKSNSTANRDILIKKLLVDICGIANA